MTLRGHIHGGMVVLDDPKGLPEGTQVEVAPIGEIAPAGGVDALGELIGTAQNLPADSSRNKQHYLYRQPKRD